jgi:hypothetical protein
MRKENITYTLIAGYNRLFAFMDTNGGYTEGRISLTITQLIRKPIGATIARAKYAMG